MQTIQRPECPATFAASITALPSDLRVSEYIGNGRSAGKAIRAGARIMITYNQNATNCGIRAYRRDGTVIDRDFSATPAGVLAVTGIDVTA